MGGPPKKKKEVPAAQMTPTPARAAQRSPAPEKTPLESPAPGKAVKRKPPTPQTVPSPGRQRAPYPEKEQGTPSTDDTGRRRAKTSQNIVPFGHGSMWQQLKTLFLCKTAKESIEFWGGLVLRGEQMPRKPTRPSKVRYYQAFGLNPNAQ